MTYTNTDIIIIVNGKLRNEYTMYDIGQKWLIPIFFYVRWLSTS